MKENSIEEDIINAQHFINSIKTDKEYKEENGWHGYYNKEIVELAKILEHILSDYKRVLKENEELKVELERQKDINTIINQKRIDKNYEKALEKSMSKFLKTNMAKDFVPIQKIKDKIEELEHTELMSIDYEKEYKKMQSRYNKLLEENKKMQKALVNLSLKLK